MNLCRNKTIIIQLSHSNIKTKMERRSRLSDKIFKIIVLRKFKYIYKKKKCFLLSISPNVKSILCIALSVIQTYNIITYWHLSTSIFSS